MTKLLAILTLSLAFSGAAQAVELGDDWGGNLIAGNGGSPSYDVRFHEHILDGDLVKIGGICASACTIFLGLPKVCLGPRAMLGFHAANDPTVGSELNAVNNIWLAKHYRPALAKQFYKWLARGAFEPGNRLVWMSAGRMRSLYGYRFCN